MPSLPSVDNLRCFLAAARLLHFRSAARAVALTPAAFGQRIRQLEDQVGAPLFTRSTRRVSLTSAGVSLVPAAERCLASAEECLRAARGETGPAATELVLGTRHELGLSWIVPQIDRLQAAHPWLRLHVYIGSGPDLLLRVRTLEIDCAVTSSRFEDPKLDTIQLHEERYVFCASASLLRRVPFRRAEHAAQHTLIDASAERPLFRYWVDAPGGGDRLRFGSATWMGNIEAIRARVAAGAGVAVLPEYYVREELRRRRFMAVLPQVKLRSDWFRLVFRVDDRRRNVFELLAKSLAAEPLR